MRLSPKSVTLKIHVLSTTQNYTLTQQKLTFTKGVQNSNLPLNILQLNLKTGLRHSRPLQGIRLSEKSQPKRLHTLWFHFYNS